VPLRVSQSVGYDAGKNIIGRKRFMTVDTGRVGAAVKVLRPVYQSDQAANKCKERVKEMGDKVSRLTHILHLEIWLYFNHSVLNYNP